MSDNHSEMFTISFWQASAARIVNYAAMCAMGAWATGSIGSGEGVSIPGWDVLIAAATGAVWAVLLVLAGGQVPPAATGALAALLPSPSQVVDVRLREAGTPKPPTVAPPSE